MSPISISTTHSKPSVVAFVTTGSIEDDEGDLVLAQAGETTIGRLILREVDMQDVEILCSARLPLISCSHG